VATLSLEAKRQKIRKTLAKQKADEVRERETPKRYNNPEKLFRKLIDARGYEIIMM
jgi:hypothetical protein